uniref:Ribosomal protein S11 n=1 Tax=Babesia orientalis TaxID=273649 RepID=A0A0M4N394_9APIC|nr:ribosomal protein S11 [Babesia orientalis]ALE29365.1 ribosomal protein S11 [Babesia orientalis]
MKNELNTIEDYYSEPSKSTYKVVNLNYKINVSTIFFKFNNIFVTSSKFKRYGNIFIFLTILKALSCGQFVKKCSSYKKVKKLSVMTLNKLLNKFIVFLVYKEQNDIHLVFKNKSYYKKTLLFLFLKFNDLKGIKLRTVSHILSYPYNGCRLKKRKYK